MINNEVKTEIPLAVEFVAMNPSGGSPAPAQFN
jgi:hypothetical protein